MRVSDDDPPRRVCNSRRLLSGMKPRIALWRSLHVGSPGICWCHPLTSPSSSTSAQPVMLPRYLQSTRTLYSSAVMADSYWDGGVVIAAARRRRCWCLRARCGRGVGVGPSVPATGGVPPCGAQVDDSLAGCGCGVLIRWWIGTERCRGDVDGHGCSPTWGSGACGGGQCGVRGAVDGVGDCARCFVQQHVAAFGSVDVVCVRDGVCQFSGVGGGR